MFDLIGTRCMCGEGGAVGGGGRRERAGKDDRGPEWQATAAAAPRNVLMIQYSPSPAQEAIHPVRAYLKANIAVH